jgi:hypothetical protein
LIDEFLLHDRQLSCQLGRRAHFQLFQTSGAPGPSALTVGVVPGQERGINRAWLWFGGLREPVPEGLQLPWLLQLWGFWGFCGSG